MKHLRLFSLSALAACLCFGAEPAALPGIPAPRSVAPVLKQLEPSDSTQVLLPGPAIPAPPSVLEAVIPPTDRQADAPGPPQTVKPIYPSGFEEDSAIFCQAKLGHWTEEQARALLGDSIRDRAAFDDRQKENGHIYAYTDPTKRYREIELDFDNTTGALRTVFVYPWKMTWQECRRLWGANAESANASKGRTFYSYLNHRIDVLVDKSGQVISLGLY